MRHLVGLLGVVAALTLVAPNVALAQGTVDQTQQTSSYKVALHVGPPETMLMPDQAATAKEGEVMVQMPGMPMPSMSMMDQGQPVNHHLEAHIYNKATGAVVDNLVPAITISNQATHGSHKLDPVMAMYGLQEGRSDLHYGGNVYLPAGTYTVAVAINGQTATFPNLAISGAVAAPAQAPMPMPGMAPAMPRALPATGGGAGSVSWPLDWQQLVIAGAGGLAGPIVARRRRLPSV